MQILTGDDVLGLVIFNDLALETVSASQDAVFAAGVDQGVLEISTVTGMVTCGL